jgi:hypothetical protein
VLLRQNDDDGSRNDKERSETHSNDHKCSYEDLVNMSPDLGKGDIDHDYKVKP